MSTQDLEKAVRDAAGNLLTAINAAKAAGLDVRWPTFPNGLSVIAISETGKVKANPEASPIAASFAASAVSKPALPSTPTPVTATGTTNSGDVS